MSAFSRKLWHARAVAIMRSNDQRKAASAMQAAVRGGFQVLEFTLNTPGAYELIAEFRKSPELTVGAGTVLSVDQAQRAVRAGAEFLVSPVTDEQVIAAARALGVAAMPGTHTPTEMWHAHRAGADFVKLFPAAAGGPMYVRSVLAPMPFLRIVPTNGVDEHNAAEYLQSGAFAIGCVTSLFAPQAMAENNFSEIESRAKRLLASLISVQRGSEPTPDEA
jgi:Entner-Doudoroff aldolase